MTLNVVEFQNKPLEVDESLVTMLKTMLKLAEDGKMTGIAVTYLNEYYNAFRVRGGKQSYQTIGCLHILADEIMQHVMRDEIITDPLKE